MTRTNYFLDDQPHGTVATAANTGFAATPATGGSIVYDDNMSFSGRTGLRIQSSTGTNTAYVRGLFATATTSGRLSVGLTVPNAVHDANVTMVSFATSADTQVMAIVWLVDGSLVWRKTSSSSTGQVVLAAAGALALGQRIRIEIPSFTISTTGGVVIKVYDANTTTQINATATVSNFDLGSTATDRINFGITGATAGVKTVGVDNVQMDDAPGAEIGPYWPAGTTPVSAERQSSNQGWTNVGGASSPVQAVSDSLDTSYIQSPGVNADESVEFRIGVLSPGDRRINFRAATTVAGGAVRVSLVELDGTVRATRTQLLTTSPADYSITLTEAENSSIVSNQGLRIRLTGNPS